jgi:Flp pilus assembly pilin Flp
MALFSMVRREGGQGLAEYALILSIIAIACIAVLVVMQGDVTDLLSTVADAV